MDIVIRSYAALPSSGEFLNNTSLDGSDLRFRPYLSKLRERLASFPEQALATICKSAYTWDPNQVNAVSRACQLLAQSIER